jgi:hypothetical protein
VGVYGYFYRDKSVGVFVRFLQPIMVLLRIVNMKVFSWFRTEIFADFNLLLRKEAIKVFFLTNFFVDEYGNNSDTDKIVLRRFSD